MSAVIEVEKLVARYGERTVLKGIDLDVQAGEIMVIMGGSGSGKSTLLRHLLGLQAPSSGTIRLLGEDIYGITSQRLVELRRKMGVAFQGGALFSSMTVGENAMLPLREHTRLDEQTMRIMMRLKLDIVNMAGCENLMPAQLSGGMIKRAAMARAIIMDPRLLFLDEPSAGLDPVVAASLDELILTLRDATGMSIVVVTHELESAFKIADRIAVLDHGDVLVCGTVAEVKSSGSERVQALLNRRIQPLELNPEEYIRRLTGGPVSDGARA
ncbi:MAG TPA: ATP-binding cassette domain-containing protein [Solimonas sp.]|nr:ATP-binding cassette domain-containing protein [Solimonas sp.]